jgi:pimeloyl-ACP methyl ester carboxylesterase
VRTSLLVIAVAVAFVTTKCSASFPRNEGNAKSLVLNFETVGSGSPVVLLHGLFASHLYWKRIVPVLRTHHQVLALDLLGFGDSPKPKIEYTVAQHLAAIETTLRLAVPEISKVTLIGHSMGAVLALNYAIAHKDKVGKIILISIPPVASEDDLKKDLEGSTSTIMLKMTFDPYWSKFFCRLHEFAPPVFYPLIRYEEPDLPSFVAKDALKHTWESFSGSYAHVLARQRSESLILQLKDVPILLLEGTEDVHVKSKLLEKVSASLPNLRVVWIKGGHNFLVENAGDSVREISAFVR